MIRLRDGETNMLAGLIRDDERRVARRDSRAERHPVVGRLFAHTHEDDEQTDIILTLTPHIIRVLDLNEADLRPFRVGRDSLAPSAICRRPLTRRSRRDRRQPPPRHRRRRRDARAPTPAGRTAARHRD